MLASAKYRPGQILNIWDFDDTVKYVGFKSAHLRPNPKTSELGSSGWNELSGC